jgi:hypothetical protein
LTCLLLFSVENGTCASAFSLLRCMVEENEELKDVWMKYDVGIDLKVYCHSTFGWLLNKTSFRITCFLPFIQTRNARFMLMETDAQVRFNDLKRNKTIKLTFFKSVLQRYDNSSNRTHRVASNHCEYICIFIDLLGTIDSY